MLWLRSRLSGHVTYDNKPSILPLAMMPPHTGSLVISTKTKVGLITEDDPPPFWVTPWQSVSEWGGVNGSRCNSLHACSPASCSHLSMVQSHTGWLMEGITECSQLWLLGHSAHIRQSIGSPRSFMLLVCAAFNPLLPTEFYSIIQYGAHHVSWSGTMQTL